DGIRDATVTGVQTCALPISNEARLNLVYRVATDWAREGQGPLGIALTRPLSNRKSVFQMLRETEINVPQIRNVYSELQRYNKLRSEERRVGKEDRIRYEAGY